MVLNKTMNGVRQSGVVASLGRRTPNSHRPPSSHRIARVMVLLFLTAIAVFVTSARKTSTHTSMRTSAADFGAAATRNAALQNELSWVFGGKQQHGWYLYTALIDRLLGTTSDPASNDFALSLARWQKKSGLGPTGVLDENSLMAMIGQWQGRRLKDRSYPQPDQLLTAPSSDFLDPARAPELRQVERETYAAYKRMMAAAIADRSLGLSSKNGGELAAEEKYLKVISAFRSREYQEQLRQKSPNSGTAGLALNSPHFTGRALDLYVGGDPVETRDANRAIQVKTPVYNWLVHNAERFGFQPYFYEPWHWEYVK